jgi:hypothetical protein
MKFVSLTKLALRARTALGEGEEEEESKLKERITAVDRIERESATALCWNQLGRQIQQRSQIMDADSCVQTKSQMWSLVTAVY